MLLSDPCVMFSDGCFLWQLVTKWSHFVEENLCYRTVFIILASGHLCGIFSWLMFDVGKPNPLWMYQH